MNTCELDLYGVIVETADPNIYIGLYGRGQSLLQNEDLLLRIAATLELVQHIKTDVLNKLAQPQLQLTRLRWRAIQILLMWLSGTKRRAAKQFVSRVDAM